MENIEFQNQNPIEIKTTLSNGSVIHYEGGMHIISDQDYRSLEQRVSQGDLTAHIWDAGIAKRMRKYGPRLLSVDSPPL